MDSGHQAIETEKAQNNIISEMELETGKGNWKMDNLSHNSYKARGLGLEIGPPSAHNL